MKGTVLRGMNNIFSIRHEAGLFECRIKGKVLHGRRDAYNPLAPGDEVEFEPEPGSEKRGYISSRIERRNGFYRWNKKRRAVQIIAANIDLCICLLSTKSPPFRPRFADRVGIMAELESIPFMPVCNKIDQGIGDETKARLDAFQEGGYEYLLCSAETGEGIEELTSVLKGKRSMFIGQSGVGKTTILNMLIPGLDQKTADISSKYNRGKHTTVFSALFSTGSFEIIDTPGIREIEVCGIDSIELDRYFPEFGPFYRQCRFPSCLHDEEPDCAVRAAVEEGVIHPDRYESYLRILFDLQETERNTYGSAYPRTP
jgi:ribosome biogenesis GTPase